MNILFLDDDDRRCHIFRSNFPSADIVNTAEEAIAALEHGEYDLICLDHDLGGEQMVNPRGKNTGSEVVRYMIKNPHPAKAIMIHTHNPPAGNQMVMALMRHYDGVYRHAFGPIMLMVTGEILDELEQQ
jgi:CheY-like chemotaxis protein